MSRPDKKATERWALDRLLDCLRVAPDVQERETPDFILQLPDYGAIGLEVTEHASGRDLPEGSPVLRLHRQRQHLMASAEREYERAGGRPIRVVPHFVFDAVPLTPAVRSTLAPLLAAAVRPIADDLYREPLTRYHRVREVHLDYMAEHRLQQHFSGLTITRFRNRHPQDRWLAPVQGVHQVQPVDVCAVVTDKERRLDRWPPVDQRWLLIVLPTDGLGELTDAVRTMRPSATFDRVYILDEINAEIVCLATPVE